MMQDDTTIKSPAETKLPSQFLKLGEILRTLGWNPTISQEQYCRYESVFSGSNMKMMMGAEVWIYVELLEQDTTLVCYSIIPMLTPPDMLQSMVELISQLNKNLTVGNFELNLDNGEIRFKNSVNYQENDLTSSLVQNTLTPCCDIMNHYLPAINGILLEGKNPEEAFNLIKQPS